jgi:hypothetical protein
MLEIQVHLVQYVEKKFMEIDYNMLVHNHVNYNMLSKKIILRGGGAMVKDLTLQCGGEEFKSSHLQPRLLWPLR